MAGATLRIHPKNRLLGWIEDRLPILTFLSAQTSEYYAPKNFNVWYYFGSLALLILVNQIVTGIFLAMFYNPSAAGAFASVEYIMRDVDWGWLIRYMHEVGASMFFIVVYLHMFRGLMYGSYKKPRELIWILGMLIFLALMAEGFLGYVLPWGNMSFWGAKVIISLFSAVPYVGDALVRWIMGDYTPADATLNRFFALHVIALPLVLLLLVVLHLAALHEVGSNNPDGVEIKQGPKGSRFGADKPADGIPFHPYYTVKDLFGVGVLLLICAFIIFFAPALGGWFLEHDNFIPANNLVTPAEIKPVWYFTPFYAMLRMIPAKLPGVIVLFVGIFALFLVPWLDRGVVKSIRYRGLSFKIGLGLFALSFVMLGAVGAGVTAEAIPHWFGAHANVTTIENAFGRFWLAIYLLSFVGLWVYTYFGLERTKPVPERVTSHD